MITTPGRIILDGLVPDDMRDDLNTPLNKKGATSFFKKLAQRHPDKYVDVMKKMVDQAGEVSAEYGRWTSVSLKDMELPPRTKAFRDMLNASVHRISQDPRLTPEAKSAKIVALLQSQTDKAKSILEEEGAEIENALALSSKNGIRGNPTQLMQMLFGDVLVSDNDGKTIPVPLLHGYVEGLTPLETWAGSYGSRAGYMCLDEDTLVRMADGSVKAIKDILPGESVLGSDLKGHTSPAKVLAVLRRGRKPAWRYTFRSSEEGEAPVILECTDHHKVLQTHLSGHTSKASCVPFVGVVGCPDRDMGLITVSDRGVGHSMFNDRVPLGIRTVMDLSVDHPDHLFVLANGAVVSNSVQFATADTGYFAKQLAHMNTGMQVLAEDCGTTEGLPIDPRSEDAAGRKLARPSGALKAGTSLTPEAVKKLKAKEVLVRSPLTCRLPHGVCQTCAGLRPDGSLPRLNSFVSLEASRVVSEPLTQKLALCLDPDTPVRMADWTIKLLKDIVPGEFVMGADSEGRIFPVKVLNRWHNGPTDMYRYTYRKGCSRTNTIEMVASQDHKIWTVTYNHRGKSPYANWIPRMESAGFAHTFVSALLHRERVPEEAWISVPDALLLGLLLGDGCYTEAVAMRETGGAVHFRCADPSLIAELGPYMRSMGLRFTAHTHSGYYRISSNATGGTFVKGEYTNPIERRLAELGMLGKKAHEKELPPGYRQWDNDSICELLSGLFITDGSIYKTGGCKTEQYTFCSASRTMLVQVRDLLQERFGIYTSAVDERPPGEDLRVHTLHSITISSEYAVDRMRRVLRWRGIKKAKAAVMAKTDEARTRASLSGSPALQLGCRCRRLQMQFVGRYRSMDLEVDHPDHRFVLANGMIVSNSAKHLGGQGGKDSRMVSGFEEVDQFVQVPDTFKGAVLSEIDGMVRDVKEAPQGGYYVNVDDDEYYVPRGLEVTVKKGARIQAGDPLTGGTMNPADVARFRGIGEGRRYFVDTYGEILKRNGVPAHRSNLELLARSFIQNVRVTDPEGVAGYRFGEILPYESLQARWVPRGGAQKQKLQYASNQYLEEPVAHYTIGTRLTPSILKDMETHGVKEVTAHKDPPGFQPQITRAAARSLDEQDWKARLGGFYLKSALQDMASLGAVDEPEGRPSVFAAIMDPSRLKEVK